ncbi:MULTISPECIES: TatD family hydrolase [Bacillus cereus group]|uniref:TatD family hydrolase n=1 Tax=Bacillus cereus HuA3-9 TaxID=1053205 RepID=R8DAK6_BACCE|nr:MULTISPECIES: TatD family hydrolase [Bacillus cereus group]EOO20866.1 TatD family hydrolase [Bacillus cereus HuA3-9]MED3613631.1 TatD family hydrolase [Bacillus wiedmannii]
MSRLSDFHVHIDYFQNYREMFQYFDTRKTYALFVTNLPEIFRESRKVFPNSKYVKLGLGYNPQLANKHKFNKSLFDKMLPHTKYVGEVGLDYSKNFLDSKLEQQEVFDYICSQSSKSNKIMSIHSRMAEFDTLSILLNNNVKFAVFHWFSGNKDTLHKVIEEGYYFSVNYSMLSSRKGLDIIKSIPLDRMLIETDAPFGKTNLRGTTYNLPEIYNEFSNKLGIEDFEMVIYNNLKKLLAQQSKLLNE